MTAWMTTRAPRRDSDRRGLRRGLRRGRARAPALRARCSTLWTAPTSRRCAAAIAESLGARASPSAPARMPGLFEIDPIPGSCRAGVGRARGRARAARARARRVRRRRLRRAADRRRGLIRARTSSTAPRTSSPSCAARCRAGRRRVAIAGLDVVRDADGDAAGARGQPAHAVRAGLRDRGARGRRPRLPGRAGGVEELGRRRDLRSARRVAARGRAAGGGGAEPSIVVLTDGPDGAGVVGARRGRAPLGCALVTLDELERATAASCATAAPGGGGPVDVVYRRTDEDRLRDDDGAPDRRRPSCSLEPWRAGTVALVNALGTGVADDKLVARLRRGDGALLPRRGAAPAARCRPSTSAAPRRSRRSLDRPASWSSSRAMRLRRRGRRRLRATPRSPTCSALRGGPCAPTPEDFDRPGDRVALAATRPSSTGGCSRATSTCARSSPSTASSARACCPAA